jgi:MoxR-like ATPase
MKWLTPPAEPVVLRPRGPVPRRVHVFDEKSVDAVNAALAAGRPLLVRGEPGTGKSQLAHAAAKVLERPLVSEVVDSRTEARDLMFRFDAVARLGEAQLLGALRGSGADEAAARKRLVETRFVLPGALWWAMNWQSALEQLRLFCAANTPSEQPSAGAQPPSILPGEPERPAGWQEHQGVVLLIDEIDKAESDVPNGLLECLADGAFRAPGHAKPIAFEGGAAPLVVITTNEERSLPDAFVRRCLVLRLELPKLPEQRAEFVALLVERGARHFVELARERELLTNAAELLADDRLRAEELGLPRPGQAEFLDLLRALHGRFSNAQARLGALARVAEFTLQKHRPLTER